MSRILLFWCVMVAGGRALADGGLEKVRPEARIAAGGDAMALYLLGFSTEGQLAWVERHRGAAADAWEWTLTIVVGAEQRMLESASFVTADDRYETFVRALGDKVGQLLSQQRVAVTPGLRLAAVPLSRGAIKLDATVGAERPPSPVSVSLTANGRKTTRTLETRYFGDPLTTPVIVGALVSAGERFAAVATTQKMSSPVRGEVTVLRFLVAPLAAR